MEKVVYKSKVDAWLVIVVVAVVVVVLLPLFSGFSWAYLLAASGVLVCLVPVFALLFSIRYIVEGDKLTVSCGILGSRAYDIMSVRSYVPPALGFHRRPRRSTALSCASPSAVCSRS